jgi:hypothetical protein
MEYRAAHCGGRLDARPAPRYFRAESGRTNPVPDARLNDGRPIRAVSQHRTRQSHCDQGGRPFAAKLHGPASIAVRRKTEASATKKPALVRAGLRGGSHTSRISPPALGRPEGDLPNMGESVPE